MTSHWTASSYKREPGESGFTNGSRPSFPPHSPVLFLSLLTVFTDQYWHQNAKQSYRTIIREYYTQKVEHIKNATWNNLKQPENNILSNTLITSITPMSHWTVPSYKRKPGESGIHQWDLPFFPTSQPCAVSLPSCSLYRSILTSACRTI